MFFAFFAFYSITYSQCFDCAKNIGGHVNDGAVDIIKTTDGFVFLINIPNEAKIQKYDFDCNLIWSKQNNVGSSLVEAITSDPSGNIYYLIRTGIQLGGIDGLTFYKLDPNGNTLWSKSIGGIEYEYIGYEMLDILYFQDTLYVIGTYLNNIRFSEEVSFSSNNVYNPNAFIARYDTDNNFINAIVGNSNEDLYKFSEIDNLGNIYLTRSSYNSSLAYVDKFNASLELDWSIILSSNDPSDNNQGLYTPTGIHFNHENNKLYLWGRMNLTTTIMGGHSFFISENNGEFQSLLTEIETTTGGLENFKRFDNNSAHYNIYNPYTGRRRSAFMTEKDNILYVWSSFRGTISFPNADAVSTKYHYDEYDSENLILFQVNLNDFSSELIFQSYGVENLTFGVKDYPGNLFFNGDDLYLTSTFESKPLLINGTTINNNSGNNNSDAMFYKVNINSLTNNGVIVATNTCFNELTHFSLTGTYDTIVWDFGDPNSANNTSTLNNPSHIFSQTGTFHITATVVCGENTETIEKDITITNTPSISNIDLIESCETLAGSGISSEFDTSTINAILTGIQQDVSLVFIKANGTVIPNELPNPYTNSTAFSETITARLFYTANPDCYVETSITFTTLSRPEAPIAPSPQSFCIQENPSLDTIDIDGQNIQWYATQTGGTPLPNATTLTDEAIYYASQSTDGCESLRVAVTVFIHDTSPPMGEPNQEFCVFQNASLEDILVEGDDIQWYASSTSTTPLPTTTLLADGTTYYATQTLNDCQSEDRLAIEVSLTTSLGIPESYEAVVCDHLADGIEAVNFTFYNEDLIENSSEYSFGYYISENGAMNQVDTDKITSFSNFTIPLGETIFYVRIESEYGCHSVVELRLNVVSEPVVVMPDETILCQNETIVLDAGAGFDTYLWSTGEETSAITISEEGSYWVNVAHTYQNTSCATTKDITVNLSAQATILDIDIQDWTSTDNIIIVKVDGPGVYEYSLNNISFQESNTFYGLNSGHYTVYVRDINGCGTTDQKVTLLSYPKYFTPNGDGYHDRWAVKFSRYEKGLITRIFDRYGKLLRELKHKETWDGTFNGFDVPSTDYWFVVTRTDGTTYKGHFSLKR